ncbi:Glycerol-3-Phosphate Acyltransferase 3-like [Carpediemonas membranifera]|uniref:Glycerol-3-Phosphate Acyltransferase 3-like n=1 Tax=Carpediemonas membranifera TaxID=201153 RepID=A0A8J6E840_9EUKA|nr:Glycerol-3-Phosphate Acyltransferase 3-like [Carpediemonas membranifera]|eukprot:KAG9391390.1 Glycerol-3-Phosphate Acyltransferase 3-like [Carpediemonas membranifera]
MGGSKGKMPRVKSLGIFRGVNSPPLGATDYMPDDSFENEFFAGIVGKHANKKATIERTVESKVIRYLRDQTALPPPSPGEPVHPLLDSFGVLEAATAAFQSVIQDQFSECFKTPKNRAWNWNLSLLIGYLIGVTFRTFIVFPLRLAWAVVYSLVFILLFALIWAAHFTFRLNMESTTRPRLQALLCWASRCTMASWSAVIVYHGMIPSRRPNQIYVANHTSLIDFLVLLGAQPFSTIGQEQGGWLRWIQRMLKMYDCVWFNRLVAKDRQQVIQVMKDHIADTTKAPMLVFPEGVCVNNKFTVQFKVGAFQLGADVCPVAIKYNFMFSNVYWNSKRESFTKYILKLWHGWAIVGDVYFLPPMSIEPGESPQQFAGRVKEAISRKARLRSTEWNGYLKYFKPNKRFTDGLQKAQVELSMEIIQQSRPELYQALSGLDIGDKKHD